MNGRHYGMRTRWLADLSDGSTAALAEAGSAFTSPFSAIAVHHFHGAASRVPTHGTAFGLRRDHFLVEMLAAWEPNDGDDGSAHRQWSQELFERLASYALPGGYPNLLGPAERARALQSYGPNLPRLLELKRKFDPHDVFASATPALGPSAVNGERGIRTLDTLSDMQV